MKTVWQVRHQDFSDAYDTIDEEFATFSTEGEALRAIDRLRTVVAERNRNYALRGVSYQEPFSYVVVEQEVYSTWEEMVEALPPHMQHLYA